MANGFRRLQDPGSPLAIPFPRGRGLHWPKGTCPSRAHTFLLAHDLSHHFRPKMDPSFLEESAQAWFLSLSFGEYTKIPGDIQRVANEWLFARTLESCRQNLTWGWDVHTLCTSACGAEVKIGREGKHAAAVDLHVHHCPGPHNTWGEPITPTPPGQEECPKNGHVPSSLSVSLV